MKKKVGAKSDTASPNLSRRQFGALAAMSGVGIGMRPLSMAAEQSSQEGFVVSCGYVQDPNTYYEYYEPSKPTDK